jgi:tRNA threonylcarbamoyladenosine biosynthesis protein TsaE
MTADLQVDLAEARATEDLGRAIAAHLRPGDLVVLTGDLGAGKTTLTRGVGAGLGVRGPVTSPTFVIARRHPTEVGGPELLHVDAYRLSSPAEVDDLDLDIEQAVAVIEWGSGVVEHLSDSRLDIRMDAVGEGRRALISFHGPRWDAAAIARLASSLHAPA